MEKRVCLNCGFENEYGSASHHCVYCHKSSHLISFDQENIDPLVKEGVLLFLKERDDNNEYPLLNKILKSVFTATIKKKFSPEAEQKVVEISPEQADLIDERSQKFSSLTISEGECLEEINSSLARKLRLAVIDFQKEI